MGRTYIVEETVGQYLSDVGLQGKAVVCGLLVGQCSPQKDYVILAARTPPKEQQENLEHPQAQLDEEWAAEHANQVSRMLPGGLSILGVFIVTAVGLTDDLQHTLRRLLFAVEKSVSRKRLWRFADEEVSERVALLLCSASKKLVCRTYDVRDPKSSARPADWKYQSALSASWLCLQGTVHINIHIPLSATSAGYALERNTRNGLTRWAKQIENGVYLINGQVKAEDCDLLEGQKKSSRGNTPASGHSFDVRVLTQLLLSPDHRSTATVQICSGSVNLKGAVRCRAFLHSSKPKVKDAVQAVKRDILNTVVDRCEILFEDLLLNERPGKKGSEKEFHILPHRVFVPIPGSAVMLCDYKFGDEPAEEIRDHFMEMLDHTIKAEDLEIAEEPNTACVSPSAGSEGSVGSTDEEQPPQPVRRTLMMKIQQNTGVIAAVAVAVFAAGVSFHYFSD